MQPHLPWLATLLLGCGSAQDYSLPASHDERPKQESTDNQDNDLDLPTFSKDTAEDDDNSDDDLSETVSSQRVIYFPEPKNWYQASARLPRGYHLPSRAELIAAIDAGWFIGSAATVGSVWSSTSVRDSEGRAWRVNLTDGYMDEVDKQSAITVIYIRNPIASGVRQ